MASEWHTFKKGMVLKQMLYNYYVYIEEFRNNDHITLLGLTKEKMGGVWQVDIDMLHENYEPAPKDYQSDFLRLWLNLTE